MRGEAKKKVKTVADLIGRAEFHVIPSFMADSIKRNTTKSTGILTAIEEHTQTQVQCPLPLLAPPSPPSRQLIYIYVQLKCLRQCLHNLTNCKAQARHVQ